MLSANFTEKEFQCPCGQCDGGRMDPEFIKKLQAVRDTYGQPMRITSGYRCPEHNKVSGGTPRSMHLKGRAADIACTHGGEKFKLMMLGIASGMNGVGIGKGFIHLDDRDEQTIWSY